MSSDPIGNGKRIAFEVVMHEGNKKRIAFEIVIHENHTSKNK